MNEIDRGGDDCIYNKANKYMVQVEEEIPKSDEIDKR
jgi:hypothetical protein